MVSIPEGGGSSVPVSLCVVGVPSVSQESMGGLVKEAWPLYMACLVSHSKVGVASVCHSR